MRENNKELSEEGRKHLYENMGNKINEFFPILNNIINILADKDNAINHDETTESIAKKEVLKFYASTLYACLEIASALRADLRVSYKSYNGVENKINLKYLVLYTSEFYKYAFFKKNKNVWQKVSSIIKTNNHGIFDEQIAEIDKNVNNYKVTYFSNGIDYTNRNIVAHYDLDVNKLYDFLCNINEEFEAKRICSFLAIIQPLINLLSLFTALYIPQLHVPNLKKDYEDVMSLYDKIVIDKLGSRLNPVLGESIDVYVKCLDKIMYTYRTPERLSGTMPKLFSRKDFDSYKSLINNSVPIILMYFVYLDLLVSLRGFILSEYHIERRFNIFRLNLVMFEAYNKIFCQKDEKGNILWDNFIFNLLRDNQEYKEKTDIIKIRVAQFEEFKEIKTMRNLYVHINDKDFSLIKLWPAMLQIDTINEFNKAKDFIDLIGDIINLSQAATKKVFNDFDNEVNKKRHEYKKKY